ncbi:penta-EF hand family protein [Streptomyces mirabilis]
MPRYRKKPVEIDAVRWTEDEPMRMLIDFTNGLVQLNDVDREFSVYDRLHDTWVKFEYGDWILKGVQGEFYPCRNDVFAATYEPA